tara:strand:+ start:23154 stop:24461 length:1308 start_codon:yes stop_codon:yes gene_type:complete
MQVLDDIWSSIKGNSKARVRDPVIGTFIVSWAVCNWDKLAVLVWGNGEAEKRINALGKSMAVIEDPSLLKNDLDLMIIPSILTLLYLFILPVISLWVKKLQNKTVLSQHSHAIQLEIKRAEQQKNLNKVALRANPEKDFLAQEVRLDLYEEEQKLIRRNKIQGYIDSKLSSAKAYEEEQSAKAEKERIELESKKRKEEIEKRRFEQQTAIHKATISSARYPAIHQMMKSLSDSLRQDGIVMSLEGLVSSLAALFGYSDSKEMIDDENFNNENLNEIKYVYHQPLVLTKRLEEIIIKENSDNEDLSEGLLFDHLSGMLEDFSIYFSSEDTLAERVSESVNEDSYDILASEELSSTIAETDTIFEEVYLEIEHFTFKPDEGFEVNLNGYASGHHRREEDMPGRDISINVSAICKPIIGTYGLSSYNLKIGGSLREYD